MLVLLPYFDRESVLGGMFKMAAAAIEAVRVVHVSGRLEMPSANVFEKSVESPVLLLSLFLKEELQVVLLGLVLLFHFVDDVRVDNAGVLVEVVQVLGGLLCSLLLRPNGLSLYSVYLYFLGVHTFGPRSVCGRGAYAVKAGCVVSDGELSGWHI